MKRFFRTVCGLPAVLLTECLRLVQYAGWSLRAALWWRAWRALHAPERWLAARYFHARQHKARFAPLPKGFDPATGRIQL
jgi:hypothetical protein